jgi:hypothetical protein
MEREKVGKIAYDLLQKSPDSVDPIEIERELHQEYEKNIYECVDNCKKQWDTNDFYIIVITKKEPTMMNVLRNYFFGRQSCPTPDYDQTVYRYHRDKEEIEFLWVIPSKDACLYLKDNALQVIESERDLLKFVLDFADGSLYNLSKKLNGEIEDSCLLKS